jgi:hypothetical protein
MAVAPCIADVLRLAFVEDVLLAIVGSISSDGSDPKTSWFSFTFTWPSDREAINLQERWMARKASNEFDEKSLSKGQLRKLNALRKSLGEEIANKDFAAWLASADQASSAGEDRNAAIIADALSELANSGKLMIPRGGYMVRRGRGRVIVERPEAAEE